MTAGKYNDGSKPQRAVLTDRVYQGIVQSEASLKRQPIDSLTWSSVELIPTPRQSLDADALAKQIADKSNAVVQRNRPSYMLAWLRRLEKKQPIILSSLHLGDTTLLHLPAECFVQYQLASQQMAPDRFVATAAYGDGGPWYIPIATEYQHGGYEVSVAFCESSIDAAIHKGVKQLLETA